MSDKNFKKIFYVLLGFTLFRMIYAIFIPVVPQEAYYWYYIQKPALSYFDHPPMTAYSIGLGCLLFGINALGVKFVPILFSLFTNLLIYQTTRRVWLVLQCDESTAETQHKVGVTALVIYNLTVAAHLYGIVAQPDVPLMFFWMAGIYSVQEAVFFNRKNFWYLAGVALGGGLLSKYPAIGILPGVVTFLLLYKPYRHWLFRKEPYLAILLGLIIFTPVVYWNYTHNWGSFGFQFAERAESVRSLTTRYLGQLLGSQMALLTPFIFILFVLFTIKSLKKTNRNVVFGFLLLQSVFVIGGFTLVSLKSLVKMNWLLPGYLSLTILTALFMGDVSKLRQKIYRIGLYSSLVLIVIAYLVQIIPNMPLGEGNTWSGWQDAAQKIYSIQNKMGGKKKVFIFANSYKSASLVKFYLPDHQETYAQNVYDRPALQFDIWPLPDSLKGKNALYIFTDRKEYKNDLKYVQPFFDNVIPLKEFNYTFQVPFSSDSIHVRTIYCYSAENYHGKN